jgi:hypothetical protein
MAERDYQIEAPDGSSLTITGPDNAAPADLRAAAERAFARVKGVAKHAAGQAAAGDLSGALETATRPAAATIPSAAAMVLPAAGAAAGTILGGPIAGPVVGAMGGQAANEAIDAGVTALGGGTQSPLLDRAKRVAEVGAGTGAAAGVTAAAGAIGRRVLGAGGPQSAISEAAQRQGVPLDWAEANPNAPWAQAAKAFASRSPASRGIMERHASGQANALQARANTLAEELRGRPGAIDIADTNNRFAKAIRAEYDGARAKTRKLYDDAFAAVGPDTPVDPTPLLNARSTLATEFPNLRPSRASRAIDDWAKSLKPAPSTEEAAIRAQFGLKPNEPIPAAFQQHIPPTPADRVPTIKELKGLKNTLSTLSRSADAVERGQAEYLRKGLDEALETTVGANPQAKALFDQAAAMHRETVVPLRDGDFKSLVRGNPKLGGPTLAGYDDKLFNPKDPGFLDDALKLAGPEGRRLIQEQYTNSRFANLYQRSPDGHAAFDSTAFAKQIHKDGPVLERLFGRSARMAVQEFAEVASATKHSQQRAGELVGLLLGVGEAHTAISAVTQGNAVKLGVALGGPQLVAKLLTTPSWTRGATSALRATGRASVTGAAALTNLMTQDQPGAPGGAPLPPPPQAGPQSRGVNPMQPPIRLGSL